jgi:hypothetical protein
LRQNWDAPVEVQRLNFEVQRLKVEVQRLKVEVQRLNVEVNNAIACFVYTQLISYPALAHI